MVYIWFIGGQNMVYVACDDCNKTMRIRDYIYNTRIVFCNCGSGKLHLIDKKEYLRSR